ncbi:MAG: ADOP family duplicated permease [Gemmatimonadota bacterium]
MRTLKRLRELARRLGGTLKRRRLEKEMDEEFRFHLQRLTERNVRSGMTPAEAWRRARLTFGSLEGMREEGREEQRSRHLEILAQDIRYALRLLRGSPGFTTVATLSLGLGIGVCTATFGLADRVLLNPLPAVRDAHEVVTAGTRVPHPLFRELAASPGAFSALAAQTTRAMGRLTPEGTVEIRAGVVSGNYFRTLGVDPLVGRMLNEGDDARGAPQVAVLSHRVWRTEFGGGRNAVGAEVVLNGRPFTVVGVAQPSFRGTRLDVDPDVWITIQGWGRARVGELATMDLASRGWSWLQLTGRLRPGETAASSGRWLRDRWTELAVAGGAEPPDELRIDQVRSAALGLGTEVQTRRFVKLFMAVVLVALLVACANVANLLLARAVHRENELAIRSALGASHGRVARQLLVESVVLAGGGAAVGMLVAVWTIRLLRGLQLPGSIDVAAVGLVMDARSLAFACGISLLTAVSFGLFPAIRGARVRPARVLGARGSGGADAARLRAGLVAFQVALCMLLLAGAGLFGRTMVNALETDVGFDREGLFGIRVPLGTAGYDPERAAAYLASAVERVRAAPGVAAAGWAAAPPLADYEDLTRFTIQDVPATEEAPTVPFNTVGPGYFEAVGIPLVKGRGFLPAETRTGSGAAVVNESFVARWLPVGEVVGRMLLVQGEFIPIVGVSRDAKYTGVAETPRPYLYFSTVEDWAADGLDLLVRAEGAEPEAMAAAVAALRGLDGSVPLAARSVNDRVAAAFAPQRTLGLLLALLAALTLVLALTGIYGVVSYSVERSRRELGVRLALGARAGDLVGMVLKGAMSSVAVGIGAGVLASLLAGRAVEALLFGVAPGDVITLASAAALLMVAGAAAAAVPAWQVTRVDPALAMRG